MGEFFPVATDRFFLSPPPVNVHFTQLFKLETLRNGTLIQKESMCQTSQTIMKIRCGSLKYFTEMNLPLTINNIPQESEFSSFLQ
jgi:hypothetical protein